jgi:hypothetical protein
LVLGGILAAVNWRLVFLVNVPFGVIGTVWAFLGYNPMAHLLPPAVLAQLHAATRAHLLSRSFFPSLIASPFMDGLRLAFYVSAAMSLVAAVASLLRGRQHFHEEAAPAGVASSRGSTASVLARTAPSRSSQSGGPVDRARATQQALPAAPTPSGYPDGHGD